MIVPSYYQSLFPIYSFPTPQPGPFPPSQLNNEQEETCTHTHDEQFQIKSSEKMT